MKKIFFAVSGTLLFLGLHASWVDNALRTMNLEQKIAQLIMPGVRLNCPESIEQARRLITDYHVGGLLLVNVGQNFSQNITVTEHLTVGEQIRLVNEFQSLTQYPLLIGQDFEYGLGARLRDGMIFPHAMTLAAMSDEKLIYEVALEIGRQARCVGVHINFAPVGDINNNPGNSVIHDRSFGDNKEAVARKAILFMQGLHDAGIISCAKHFPGHGDTDVDSHYDLPCLLHTKDRLYDLEIYPFKRLIEAGVPMIMSAHLHIPVLDKQEHLSATLSSAVITQLLKQDLGFRGVVVTDGLRMSGIAKYFTSAQAAIQAFVAGNDILLDIEDPVSAIKALTQAVQEGVILESQIDERVRKIFALKQRAGLTSQSVVLPEVMCTNEYAKKLKKEAYRQAITLARDRKKLVPIDAGIDYAYLDFYGKSMVFRGILSQYVGLIDYCLPADPAAIVQDGIIVPLYQLNRIKKQDYGVELSLKKFLQDTALLGKDLVVIVFGTPYVLDIIPPQATVIVAYEQEYDAQEAAAEALVGRFIPQGKLPVFCL